MFYAFLRGLVRFLLFILNGRVDYQHLERIPDRKENYILIAPHRMAWEPIFYAFAARPKQFIFMAKKELFNHKFGGWWIKKCGAFPIDREHPSPQTLKYAVKMLKTSDKSLIMFPSGSRHSTELKGGAAVIGTLAKVRLVPAIYQGPLQIKGIFKRQKVHVNFGEPIDISDIKKPNDEGIAEVNRRLEAAFAAIDKELNPNFHYEVK